MTTPTAESMKKASEIIAGWDNWDDTGPLMSEIALALDNAREAGLREAAKACRERAEGVAAHDLGDTVTFVWVRDTLLKQADALDSLAPAKTKGTE